MKRNVTVFVAVTATTAVFTWLRVSEQIRPMAEFVPSFATARSTLARRHPTVSERSANPTEIASRVNEVADPVVPSQSSDSPERLRPSHPFTSEHRRIEHELDLIRRLNDAFDRRDPARMRLLLETYLDAHGEDPHAMQEGYEILADCIDSSRSHGVTERDRARDYYEREPASTLRRLVRRTCGIRHPSQTPGG